MNDLTIGVDISKDHLDVFRSGDGCFERFDNNMAGFSNLKIWLGRTPVRRVVYEATGAYHRQFETACCGDLPLVKVNPLQARRFAQACGTRAKTDKVDARLLARMGQTMQLHPDQPVSVEQQVLKELQVHRRGLVKERARLKNRLETQTLALTRKHTKARLRQLEKQIEAADAEIEKRLRNDTKTARACDILMSIDGVGKVLAHTILVDMPEIGTLSGKQLANLCGLAPITRQSGKWQGRSFIQGGRKPLRDALYMPGLVACRHNPDLKAFYQRLVNAGKPKKVAIVAVMRKLIILANALVRDNRKWQPRAPVKGETGNAGATAPFTGALG